MTRRQLEILNRYRAEGSPVSLGDLATDLSISIVMRELEPGKEGHLGYDYRQQAYFIVVSARSTYGRQRFTIAHELGHFLWHRELLDARLQRCGKTEGEENIDALIEREGFNTEEREANIFAANLLMPKEEIRDLFYELKDGGANSDEIIERLAETFEVSFAAIKERLAYLGLMLK